MTRFELTAAASATIHKKLQKSIKVPSSSKTTLIMSNEKMEIKIVKSLKTIENEAKKQKDGFLSTLLSIFGASLLGNLWAGKGAIQAGERTIRAA